MKITFRNSTICKDAGCGSYKFVMPAMIMAMR